MTEKIILGIDEVGRGPWAGPLVVGAVILGNSFPGQDELTDSKKLTAKKRAELSEIISKNALATGLGWVKPAEIDRYGLGPSLKLATRRAVKQVLATKTPFSEIIIDGTVNFLTDTPLESRVTLMKKADLLIKEVSAASIIAKVARDDYMVKLADIYPDYGFERHVGYGTALHQAALKKLGPCPEHRRSFRPIREICDAPRQNPAKSHHNTTDLGTVAESIVAAHLLTLGHAIIARNFKTAAYEIDIISQKSNEIYFTEVKYRKNSQHGSPLEQITTEKHAQMAFAAEQFLSQTPEYRQLEPHLAVASVSGTSQNFDEWFVLSG